LKIPKESNFLEKDSECLVNIEWLENVNMNHNIICKPQRCPKEKRELYALKTIHSGVQATRAELALNNENQSTKIFLGSGRKQFPFLFI
jgi:hypothetical protein